jgi:hypothetical protein
MLCEEAGCLLNRDWVRIKAWGMRADKNTLSWLLDSDPSLKWQVERDLISAPAQVWQATRDKTVTERFGAKLLSLQDDDG